VTVSSETLHQVGPHPSQSDHSELHQASSQRRGVVIV
jgi:hypothetical protein